MPQARAILAEQDIDIVLLDVRLPDGNGLDLLREIKSGDPDLGVVVMSASVLPEEREEAIQAGSDAFVAKPYVPGDLLATLQRHPAGRPARRVAGAAARIDRAGASAGLGWRVAVERIGFVGLGTMGAAMAANLARAGFGITVWNRTPGRAPELDELGVPAAPRRRPRSPRRATSS